MNSNIPSLSEFIEIIDPEKKINRSQAAMDFGLIVAMKSAADLRDILSEEGKRRLNLLFSNENELSIEEILEIFFNEDKKAQILDTIEEKTVPATKNYISEQLKHLPDDVRTRVFQEYPDLKSELELE